MRLFIYESLSAGGLGGDAPASLRIEGAAMLAAALTDFGSIPGVDVMGLIDPSIPGSWGPACQRTASNQELHHFLRLVREADATLVIAPETAGVLKQRSSMVEEAGSRLLGCRPRAVRMTADKVALARYWQSRQVVTPVTIEVDSRQSYNLTYPVVLKPRYGAGSQGTIQVMEEMELKDALIRAQAEMPGAEFCLQKYVPGRAASVAFLIGPRQQLPLAPAWQFLSDDGRLRYQGGSLPLPTPWRERALRLGEQALEGINGLQGYVGVDLVLGEDGSDYAIEINSRLTTSYLGLRQLAKTNLAEIWLRLLDGEMIDPIEWQDENIRFTPTSISQGKG